MLNNSPTSRFPKQLQWWCAALFACVMTVAQPCGAQDGGAAPTDIDTAGQQATEPEEQGADQPQAQIEGPPLPPPETALPTVAEFDARIADLEQREARTAAQDAELQYLRAAREALQKATQSAARAAAFEREAAGAPARLQAIRAELGRTTEVTLSPELRDAAVADVEAQLQAARSQLEVDRQQRATVETDEQRRSERRQVIPTELAQKRDRLQEIHEALDDAAPPQEDPAVTSARRLALRAERALVNQQINELEQERRSYDARRDLLDARRKQAEERIRRSEQRVKLESLLNEKRAAAAEAARRAAEQASREAQSQHPVLRTIAEQNREFASETEELLAEQTIEATATRRTLQSQFEQLRNEFSVLREQAELGLTQAIALRLRNMRAKLPEQRELQRRIRERRSEFNRVQLRLMELRDLQTSLQLNRQEEARQRLRSAGVTPRDEEYDALLERTADALAQQDAQYLDPLVNALEIYSTDLFDNEQLERQLLQLVEQFRSFIDERILWVQSARPIGVDDVRHAWDAMLWLTSPSRWSNLAAGLWRDFTSTPAVIVLALLVIAAIRWGRRRYLRLLDETGEAARSMVKGRMAHTMAALGLTVLLALPTTLLLWLVAWRLEAVTSNIEFATAIAPAVWRLVAPVFIILLIWHVCRPGGLGEAHFRWQHSNLRLIRRLLRLAAPIALPLLFVLTALDNQPVVAFINSLGRVAFLAMMLVMAYIIRRLLSPTHGILKQTIAEHPNGWLARLKYVWFPAVVLIPIVLAGIAAAGYFYTAIQLEQRAIYTVRLIVILVLVFALLQRWLHLAQRRVALEQASRSADQRTAAVDSTAGARVDPQTVDVSALSSQTMKLLRTGAYFAVLIGVLAIWSDVFPAFGMLREVTLWSEGTPAATATDASQPLSAITGGAGTTGADTTGAEAGGPAGGAPQPGGNGDPAGAATATAGADGQTAEDGITRITLADLVYALFILLITVIISRDVPGLLEFAVLQRLPITYGARYAITTVTRYTIVIVGVILAFNAIGIGWSKVQFLAAAITVGLGFGLQEIFANFVSGLIILFERPVRVGDTVTVGEISGTVARIRMRATTITDWDRKELIIPNKEFVTGQIVNWSLSDAILRVIVPVGIAYGSDTEKAKEILLRVAHEDEIVLDDPPPRALFLGFGDSSLQLDVRVFIPSTEYFLRTRDALHEAIDREFRKAGIEIAFPQRDLHLRSYPPELLGQRSLDSPELPKK